MVVIFRGYASISLSCDLGELILEGNGCINHVDESLWKEIYSKYKMTIDDFVNSNIIEISDRNFKQKVDEEAKKETLNEIIQGQRIASASAEVAGAVKAILDSENQEVKKRRGRKKES